MRFTIEKGLPQKHEWKVGDVFEWRGGLYVVKTVSNNLVVVVIVPAVSTAATPAGHDAHFPLNDIDMRLVTELKATI